MPSNFTQFVYVICFATILIVAGQWIDAANATDLTIIAASAVAAFVVSEAVTIAVKRTK